MDTLTASEYIYIYMCVCVCIMYILLWYVHDLSLCCINLSSYYVLKQNTISDDTRSWSRAPEWSWLKRDWNHTFRTRKWWWLISRRLRRIVIGWIFCNWANTAWSASLFIIAIVIADDKFLSDCYFLCIPGPACGATMKSWAEDVGLLKSFLMELMPSAPRCPVLFKTPTLMDRMDMSQGRLHWTCHKLCHTVTPTFLIKSL